MPIFIFQAQVCPPLEELWKRIQKTCDNVVSSGEATAEKAFVLWSGELARLPRKEGGFGLVDPKVRIDGMAVRMVGKMLAEKNATKRWLAEKAAALPQGEATLYADPSAGKHWPGGSQRWKAAVDAFWDSPYATLPEPTSGWEVEQERLCFNRRIVFRGKSTYGNQQGTEELRKAKLGDLVSGELGAERKVKSKEMLREELGGVAVARWALMAYAATLKEWKELATARKTAEKLAEATDVVRTVELKKEAKMEDWAEPVKAVFRPEHVEPVATRGGRVLGAVGAPAERLKMSKLCPLVLPVIGALLRSLWMLDPSSNLDLLGALLFEQGNTRSGFPAATLVATTFRHIWLARCNMVWRGEAFQRKKVARGAIREFVQHAQVYRTELTRRARRKGTAK
ncbi:unnamed protein product [Closterium sp. NIES-64]|nr:unnamed protein product [Closterium sp. NIES-64]